MSREWVAYATPGRECAHADKGCCPKCMDPQADRGVDWRRIKFSGPHATTA